MTAKIETFHSGFIFDSFHTKLWDSLFELRKGTPKGICCSEFSEDTSTKRIGRYVFMSRVSNRKRGFFHSILLKYVLAHTMCKRKVSSNAKWVWKIFICFRVTSTTKEESLWKLRELNFISQNIKIPKTVLLWLAHSVMSSCSTFYSSASTRIFFS